jgi:hypothetical protein
VYDGPARKTHKNSDIASASLAIKCWWAQQRNVEVIMNELDATLLNAFFPLALRTTAIE